MQPLVAIKRRWDDGSCAVSSAGLSALGGLSRNRVPKGDKKHLFQGRGVIAAYMRSPTHAPYAAHKKDADHGQQQYSESEVVDHGSPSGALQYSAQCDLRTWQFWGVLVMFKDPGSSTPRDLMGGGGQESSPLPCGPPMSQGRHQFRAVRIFPIGCLRRSSAESAAPRRHARLVHKHQPG